jgi:hypothetical protein
LFEFGFCFLCFENQRSGIRETKEVAEGNTAQASALTGRSAANALDISQGQLYGGLVLFSGTHTFLTSRADVHTQERKRSRTGAERRAEEPEALQYSRCPGFQREVTELAVNWSCVMWLQCPCHAGIPCMQAP